MSLPLHVIGERVLVAPIAQPTKTDSGIELVETLPPEQMGTVVSIGEAPRCPTCNDRLQCELVADDVVVFAPETGQEIVIEGARYVLLKLEDVLGIVESV